jgi:hypothetical protein
MYVFFSLFLFLSSVSLWLSFLFSDKRTSLILEIWFQWFLERNLKRKFSLLIVSEELLFVLDLSMGEAVQSQFDNRFVVLFINLSVLSWLKFHSSALWRRTHCRWILWDQVWTGSCPLREENKTLELDPRFRLCRCLCQNSPKRKCRWWASLQYCQLVLTNLWRSYAFW